MGRDERHLHEGEEVIADVRPHWWFLVGPVALFVVVLAGAIAALALSAPTAVKWLMVVVLVVAAAILLRRYLKWTNTHLVITTQRLIRRTGVLERQGRDIPLDHLNDVSYRQSLFDRLIGCGDVLIESAGRDGQERFPDLPHPARLQSLISGQMEARADARRASTAGPDNGARGAPSIPEQIQQLDDLRRQGIISQAEFDAKKRELLNRL
ncbi:MAG: PH domain-containing protein [Acidimicrobiales bacterium]